MLALSRRLVTIGTRNVITSSSSFQSAKMTPNVVTHLNLAHLLFLARDNRHLYGVPPDFLGGAYPLFEFGATEVGVKYPCDS